MRLRFVWLICSTFLLVMPAWTQAQTDDCSGLSPVPLIVGEFGQVSPGQSNNVRDKPSKDGLRLGLLEGGEQFAVMDGPVCADGLVWWQVKAGVLIGWTVDGSDGEQWLIPVSEPILDTKPPAILSTTLITPENASQLQVLRSLSCESGPASSATIALSSHYVAVNCGFYNSKVPNIDRQQQYLLDHLGIIDLESGQEVMILSGEGSTVYPIAFVSDDRLLWFSRETLKSPVILHLSDVTSGEEIATTEIDIRYDTSLLYGNPIFYANKTRFALLYEDEGNNVLHHWDARTLTSLDEQVFERPESKYNISSFAISGDGKRFATITETSYGSELAIYSTTNPQPEAVTTLPFAVFNNSADIIFSPSGYFIIGAGCREATIACGNPGLYWWNAADGTQVAEWEVPGERSGRLRFSPDGKLLVMDSKLFTVESGELAFTLPTYSFQTIFSADGTFIVTQSDPLTTIWTVQN